jgi:hypothetical protein
MIVVVADASPLNYLIRIHSHGARAKPAESRRAAMIGCPTLLIP